MLRKLLVGLAMVVAVCAAGSGTAKADQISEMVYTQIVGDNLNCSQDDECASIMAANEILMGLPAGSIQVIGKFTPSTGVLTDLGAPFVGHDLNESWVCDEVTGCMLSLDFSSFDFDWQIVKIIMKDGKVTNPLGGDGDFIRSNMPLETAGNVDDIQFAHVSIAQRDIWLNEICAPGTPGCSLNNGRYSHFWVFGVRTEGTTVPEPATLVLLGMSVIAVGAVARKRAGR